MVHIQTSACWRTHTRTPAIFNGLNIHSRIIPASNNFWQSSKVNLNSFNISTSSLSSRNKPAWPNLSEKLIYSSNSGNRRKAWSEGSVTAFVTFTFVGKEIKSAAESCGMSIYVILWDLFRALARVPSLVQGQINLLERATRDSLSFEACHGKFHFDVARPNQRWQ